MTSKAVPVQNISCQNCSLSQLCLPYSLDSDSLSKLDDIIERHKPLHKRDRLFSAADKLQCLFAVRSGSFKSFTINQDGEEQITGFHLPGDLIGFDAIHEQQHQSYAEALETSMVCKIPYTILDDLGVQIPALRQQMMRLMSAEINADKRLHNVINNKSAEQRIATFITTLATRFGERGLSARQFRLSMTRAEIGNYLGLTVETVSRLMNRLQNDSLIDIDGKFIHILDETKLAALAQQNRDSPCKLT